MSNQTDLLERLLEEMRYQRLGGGGGGAGNGLRTEAKSRDLSDLTNTKKFEEQIKL